MFLLLCLGICLLVFAGLVIFVCVALTFEKRYLSGLQKSMHTNQPSGWCIQTTSIMDQLQVGSSPQAEANKFYATLRSSGYDQAYARELARLVRSLMKSTSSLQTRAGQQLNLIIDPGGNDMPLQHDERLLPYWERFTDALSSRSKCSALTRFALINVKMNDRKVAEMLLKTVKNAPLNVLYFCNNGLGEREYNWIINLLNANTSLQTLCIGSNPMNPSQELVANLSKAVVDHSKLDVILLEDVCLSSRPKGSFLSKRT